MYLATLQHLLAPARYREKIPCLLHNQDCPYSPRVCAHFRGCLWVEIAGTICCPWSNAGDHCKWMSAATLLFLIWLGSICYFEPDVFLHECTPRFPFEKLKALISTNMDIQAKSDLARSMLMMKLASPEWRLMTQIICPTDFGVPSRRRRRYTCGLLSHTVQGMMQLAHSFGDLYNVEMLALATVYFDFEDWTPAEHCGDVEEGSLTVAEAIRLEGHQLAAYQRGLCNDNFEDWTVPMAVVNVVQTCSYSKTAATHCMPTCIRKSKLFDMASARTLPVKIHWLAQGVPHPCALSVSDELKTACPFSALLFENVNSKVGPPRPPRRRRQRLEGQPSTILRPLSDREERSLTGNQMHWAAIGTFLGHIMLLVEVQWHELSQLTTE